jgi:hypothetical protein
MITRARATPRGEIFCQGALPNDQFFVVYRGGVAVGGTCVIIDLFMSERFR